MAPSRRVRYPGRGGVRSSKNTVGRTHSTKDKAGPKQKPTDVFDFPDNSVISSISRLGDNEKDEEPYEIFDPPLHSTAIYADEEEFSKHCASAMPSTPRGKEVDQRSDTYEIEAGENVSIEMSAKKKTQKKMFCGKRKKSRSEATDSDTSDSVHIWCLEGKKASDITELDVVLSAFEKTILEYKQKAESKICKEAIKQFHSNMKEELIKMLKEVQVSKALKRKNTKIISDIEKKRQRLLELQDELLGLDPQLKQLQIKYDELKERRASLRNAACFLSNLTQLHQDYSDIQEKEPYVKETYDSSSLPALLLKARTLLGAGNHLQNINHQLEKLLDQKDQSTGT
ncbi:centromere protein U isoform X3 [Ursus maritimus]|uniref:Centromere protein U n=1 Tax=Ursus maritimus TaxID=29073 RepID=A0A8M1H415_URSMA|nr:centromere protein U isoform X3 [Ursus maritimus]